MNRLVALLSVLFLVAINSHVVQAAGTVESARKKGFLAVGVRMDAPPFGFTERSSGELVGIDVEFAKAIASRLGVSLKLKPVTSEERIPELLSGHIDLIATPMTRTPDRLMLVDFSRVYFHSSQRVLARKGAVSSITDLAGKKVAVAPGSAAERNLKTKAPGAILKSYGDIRKAVDALRSGEVDAISASILVLNGSLSALPKGEYEIPKSVVVSDEGLRLAVRKSDSEFLDLVNATISELAGSGEDRNIFDRYLKNGTTPSNAAPAPQAAGVVTRLAATEGRLVVLSMKGVFRPGAEVSIFDPEGSFVGKGTVESTYEDEVYIDAPQIGKGLVQRGFAATMNYDNEAAKKGILAHQDIIKRVTQAAKQEDAQRIAEEGRQFEQEKKERAKYQDEMAKTKMTLDYQYGDYGYYPYPWGW
ncbi:MAG TPA: transporter substrate-binding domain-containing protein [Candidatus Deferrimicrobiaceae bacterium]|jgi:polar amino acid transport system substrate-binding protein